jgi:HSP20 family protein
MANIIKKNDDGQMTQWDPFQAMREMMRWDPFRDMAPILPQLDRSWLPSFEVRENRDGYVFKADLPGVKKEDIEVSLTGNRLQISGKRDEEKEAKDDTYYTYERSYGSFSRMFTLPEGADAEHVKTELKDGVLTLVLPKKPEAQPKKIPISAGASKS